MNALPTETTLPAEIWRQKAAAHLARARSRTLAARDRKDRGLPHPIDDFLFQYYPFPLALLENWQPGIGVALEWPDDLDLPTDSLFPTRSYRRSGDRIIADPGQISEKERQRIQWMGELLAATASRLPVFSCHGLHEWAMVYGGKTVRHEKTTPLRLPQPEIDAFVASRAICCSHHDAFRFFAPAAKPMNRFQPSLESRIDMEQPGCVHANMDLYKWAAKMMPWTGSDLLLDCFELAIELRDLDMRASPYDLTAWGREPIKIETAEGRRIYEVEQKRLSGAGVPLRSRLIAVIRETLAKSA